MSNALPYALAVAFSPVAIASILVLLTSRRAAANGTLFAVGWTIGVALLAAAFAALVHQLDLVDEHPSWVAGLELAIGLACLGAAVFLILSRGRRTAYSGSIIGAVDTVTPRKAAGLGIVLSGANPKVIALTLGAAVALARSGGGAAKPIEGVAAFTLVGAAGILIPLGLFLLFPSRSGAVLQRTRAALTRNETALLSVLGLAIGTLFLVDGMRSLG